jgi:6-phosphogluconate dehydrogenase
MRIGMVGLGRMGGAMARRLMKAGHACVVHDQAAKPREVLAAEGATEATSLAQLVEKLVEKPRAVWLMLPAGAITEKAVDELFALLAPGDIIIDGGNSFYKDDIARAKKLAERNIRYVDCGTSGGVWGLERGYIHAGPAGAGHFVKMVHNGIEYGLMQAYAEGFDILARKNAPELPQPERFDLNLAEIAEVWRRGSVVSSWLLDLSAAALAKDAKLDGFSGAVDDSGEGRWTIEAAIEEAVPANVLSAALYTRFRSREAHTFGEKLLSAMRFGFGGHVEKQR